MTENTAVMLRLLRLPWTLDPIQTANSGAPVQRLIEQRAEAVTRPIFFSAIPVPYLTYGAVALPVGSVLAARRPRGTAVARASAPPSRSSSGRGADGRFRPRAAPACARSARG